MRDKEKQNKKKERTRLTPAETLDLYFEEKQNIVGTFIKAERGSFIIPDDEKLGQSIDVKSLTDRGQTVMAHAISGQKVVAAFGEDFPDTRAIHVVELLGNSGTVGVDVLSIIRAHNLYEEFSNEVLHEAKKVSKPVPDEEIARRLDLRNKLIITVDPADAHDLDDAISLDKNDDGTYELGVHIADVSHYVTADSELDKEAFKRGTSVYFPDRVLPMLPPQLSNNICSLNPNEVRLALSVFMTIDRSGAVIKHNTAETVIQTNTRFSYDEVQQILDGDKELIKQYKNCVPLLNNMADLTLILEESRRRRGEVVFDVPEPKILLDAETGKISDVIAYPHLLAHRTIESFMIVCNETVAQELCELDLPFIYRVHEKPDSMKVARFIDMLKPFAVSHDISAQNPTCFQYQKMIDSLDDNIRPIISQLALRSMQKAKYFQVCLGHFGLASKYYCHFTSPIRRYPDLLIHRITKMLLRRELSTHTVTELTEIVETAADQSSRAELKAVEAEREVNNLKRAEYMNDHIGEKFSGTVSGIMDFGVFVYLPNTVEGLIKIDNMPPDNYTFNEKQATLVGRKHTYKMGDPIDIICIGVNMARRQVEFGTVNQ